MLMRKCFLIVPLTGAILAPAAFAFIFSSPPRQASPSPAPRANEPAAATAPHLPNLAGPGEWTSFTTADGLPSNEVFAVRIDGERVWAGTSKGLAVYEEGRWRAIGTSDGLPHRVILSLDVSRRTGDLWIGTMGGLARLSGGPWMCSHR